MAVSSSNTAPTSGGGNGFPPFRQRSLSSMYISNNWSNLDSMSSTWSETIEWIHCGTWKIIRSICAKPGIHTARSTLTTLDARQILDSYTSLAFEPTFPRIKSNLKCRSKKLYWTMERWCCRTSYGHTQLTGHTFISKRQNCKYKNCCWTWAKVRRERLAQGGPKVSQRKDSLLHLVPTGTVAGQNMSSMYIINCLRDSYYL